MPCPWANRLTHGTLISGALATQLGGSPDRLVPPRLFGGGVGTAVSGVHAVPDTLLGPEETDRAGPLRRACCLFHLVRDRPSCQTGSMHLL